MEEYYSFMAEGYSHPFSYILKLKVETIILPEFWTFDEGRRVLMLSCGSGVEQRDSSMASTAQSKHESGLYSELRKLSSELCAVYDTDGEIVLVMDRSAAGLFGIRTYGVFLIAFTETSKGRKFWVAQRARNKMTHPGNLDMCVGGSVRAEETPIDCLVREGEEEASIPAALSRGSVQPCGALTYHMATNDHVEPASRPQTQYVYELELSMTPKPCDGQVEGFKLTTLKEIVDALGDCKFKTNIAMTWINYLVRHGNLHAENEKRYLEICSRLHRNLDIFIRE